MTKYELSITKNYAPDWTVVDSIREFFQNALDQQITKKDNPMFWSYENGVFKVGNANSKLETTSLLLGSSTKTGDDDTIGQFGEGYKIATLVLTRLGKKVKIYNYGAKELWTAYIGYSKKYKTDLLIFNVDKKYPWTHVPDNDLTIEIEGISEDEMKEIKASNLHMQEYESIKLTDGEILKNIELRGKMFVNGLYINEVADFKYGYNFKPSSIKLDRDRKLIRQFDLQWITSQMWSTVEDEVNSKLASNLIKEGAPDVKYIKSSNYNSMTTITKNVVTEFVDTHGSNAVPVTNQSEAELVPKSHKPIIVDAVVKDVIESSEDYKAPTPTYMATFLDKVELWLITHDKNIKREYVRELKNLINEEKNKKDDDGYPF